MGLGLELGLELGLGGSARPARSAVARSRAEPVAAVAARASVAERARLTKALVMKA